MRKFAVSLFSIAFASTAWAGTVSFDPASVDVLPGETARFDVSISSTDLAQFDSISLLLGNDDGAPLSFSYDDAYVALTTLTPPTPVPFGVFASDVNIGGSRFVTPAFEAPLLIGQLSVDTTGLAEGAYDVFASSSREVGAIGSALSGVAFDGGALEDLEGTGTFNVVPEPATLVLLGLGGVAATFRRRVS